MEIAERSKSGPGNEGVVPVEGGVGGARGVFGKWAETGVAESRVTESNMSPGPGKCLGSKVFRRKF